jgi:hypothetical protein
MVNKPVSVALVVISQLPTRTKPQAPRSLQQWLASSVEAGKQAYAAAAMTNPSEFGELET